MSSSPIILYDGWALAYHPSSWEAIHLLSLLSLLPTGVRAQVALPASPFEPLLPGVESILQQTPDTPWGWLNWEQRILLRLARERGANLLHWMGTRAALFGSIPQLISPAGYNARLETRLVSAIGSPAEASRTNDLSDRLRLAMGQGGSSRAVGLCWPNDLPEPGPGIRVFKLPPLAHPRFTATIQTPPLPDLPETYILYHGPHSDRALHRLVQAWSWATGPIGEYYPLLVLGLDRAGAARLNAILDQAGLSKTVSLLPPLPLESTIYLYQHCTAVFHPAEAPVWGSPLRSALICGKPLVALETRLSDALAGPAAYLIHPNRPDANRALGAALITVIVEEDVATRLAQAGRERSKGWHNNNFTAALEEVYHSLADS